jgi:hypothetical protein
MFDDMWLIAPIFYSGYSALFLLNAEAQKIFYSFQWTDI